MELGESEVPFPRVRSEPAFPGPGPRPHGLRGLPLGRRESEDTGLGSRTSSATSTGSDSSSPTSGIQFTVSPPRTLSEKIKVSQRVKVKGQRISRLATCIYMQLCKNSFECGNRSYVANTSYYILVAERRAAKIAPKFLLCCYVRQTHGGWWAHIRVRRALPVAMVTGGSKENQPLQNDPCVCVYSFFSTCT